MRFSGILLALAVALGGAASAQTGAQHSAVVGIPTVLKLKLAPSQHSASASQPIAVRVENGVYDVTPGRSELQVFSNVPWQLSVAYRPASAHDAQARLRWRQADQGWSSLTSTQKIVDEGGSTGGWQQRTVDYDLDGAVPADGVYQGTITYVLSQP